MKESEAKTKWCPFVRVLEDEGAAFNRDWDGALLKSCLCVGSACMAWRWWWGRAESTPRIKVGDGQDEGYRGLAGKP